MTTRPQYPTPLPTNMPVAATVRTTIRPDTTERRVLVIGKGISITGTISDAERVVVEGSLDSEVVRAGEFSVSPGGYFKGEAEVDEAEVAGTIEGTVTARHSLQVRATGKLIGVARCRRLQVEDGGQITGKVEMLTDQISEAPAPPSQPIHAEAWPSALPVKPDLSV